MKCCMGMSRCSSTRYSILLLVLLAGAWTLPTCGLLLPVNDDDSISEQDVQHVEPAEEFGELEKPLGVTDDNVNKLSALNPMPLSKRNGETIDEIFDQHPEKPLKDEKQSSTKTKPFAAAVKVLRSKKDVKALENMLNLYLEKPSQMQQQQQQRWQDEDKTSINRFSAPDLQASAQVHEDVEDLTQIIKQGQQVQTSIPGGVQQPTKQKKKQKKQVETLKVNSHVVKQLAKHTRVATQADQQAERDAAPPEQQTKNMPTYADWQAEPDAALLIRYFPFKIKLRKAMLKMFEAGGSARLNAAGNAAKALGNYHLQEWLDSFASEQAHLPEGGALRAAQHVIASKGSPLSPAPEQQTKNMPTYADWQAEEDASVLAHTFSKSQDSMEGALRVILESGGPDRIKAAEKAGKAKGYSRDWQERLEVFAESLPNRTPVKKQQ